MPFTITSYRARRHYIHLAAKIDRTSRSKKERKGKKRYTLDTLIAPLARIILSAHVNKLYFSLAWDIMQILVHSVKIMYTVPLLVTTLFSVASKSPCPPKNLTTRIFFFHATPFNTLISPGAVFPDTCSRDLIMQMYEVKRPGPSYDRSETTPARSCGCSLYRERSG